ncbi:hypothetical protein JN531_001525 [Flagellatimonas centrodinii]|uniref:hypothetical protein n=1 Tax=Flagellatimonas centrodinii TaxID=2806210 RepID=UPI001FEEF33F|nr:hypothetical protein [Flagellatimonas centrodinii]ULQ46979.1 hypothetical protein JN531_001525 [Flagellatimonas centrodinii]
MSRSINEAMMGPKLYQIDELMRVIRDHNVNAQVMTPYGTKWVPARPLRPGCGFFYRCRAAWLVFIGKADALQWRGQS